MRRAEVHPFNALAQRDDGDAARYERLTLLGQGSTSTVYRARRREDDRLFAYKLVKLAGFTEEQRADILNEVDVMTRVHHPNVVAYEESFVHADMLHIVMELLPGGDLAAEIESRTEQQAGNGSSSSTPSRSTTSTTSPRYLDEEVIWSILVQVCEGLEHMHSVRVLHRDIKAENIYSDGRGAVKIGDLGLGRLLSSRSTHARTGVGTPLYFSPEMCEERPYNSKSDVWALGCLAYELCALRPPFLASNQLALAQKILNTTPAPLPRHYSMELQVRASAAQGTCRHLLPPPVGRQQAHHGAGATGPRTMGQPPRVSLLPACACLAAPHELSLSSHPTRQFLVMKLLEKQTSRRPTASQILQYSPIRTRIPRVHSLCPQLDRTSQPAARTAQPTVVQPTAQPATPRLGQVEVDGDSATAGGAAAAAGCGTLDRAARAAGRIARRLPSRSLPGRETPEHEAATAMATMDQAPPDVWGEEDEAESRLLTPPGFPRSESGAEDRAAEDRAADVAADGEAAAESLVPVDGRHPHVDGSVLPAEDQASLVASSASSAMELAAERALEKAMERVVAGATSDSAHCLPPSPPPPVPPPPATPPAIHRAAHRNTSPPSRLPQGSGSISMPSSAALDTPMATPPPRLGWPESPHAQSPQAESPHSQASRRPPSPGSCSKVRCRCQPGTRPSHACAASSAAGPTAGATAGGAPGGATKPSCSSPSLSPPAGARHLASPVTAPSSALGPRPARRRSRLVLDGPPASHAAPAAAARAAFSAAGTPTGAAAADPAIYGDGDAVCANARTAAALLESEALRRHAEVLEGRLAQTEANQRQMETTLRAEVAQLSRDRSDLLRQVQAQGCQLAAMSSQLSVAERMMPTIDLHAWEASDACTHLLEMLAAPSQHVSPHPPASAAFASSPASTAMANSNVEVASSNLERASDSKGPYPALGSSDEELASLLSSDSSAAGSLRTSQTDDVSPQPVAARHRESGSLDCGSQEGLVPRARHGNTPPPPPPPPFKFELPPACPSSRSDSPPVPLWPADGAGTSSGTSLGLLCASACDPSERTHPSLGAMPRPAPSAAASSAAESRAGSTVVAHSADERPLQSRSALHQLLCSKEDQLPQPRPPFQEDRQQDQPLSSAPSVNLLGRASPEPPLSAAESAIVSAATSPALTSYGSPQSTSCARELRGSHNQRQLRALRRSANRHDPQRRSPPRARVRPPHSAPATPSRALRGPGAASGGLALSQSASEQLPTLRAAALLLPPLALPAGSESFAVVYAWRRSGARLPTELRPPMADAAASGRVWLNSSDAWVNKQRMACLQGAPSMLLLYRLMPRASAQAAATGWAISSGSPAAEARVGCVRGLRVRYRHEDTFRRLKLPEALPLPTSGGGKGRAEWRLLHLAHTLTRDHEVVELGLEFDAPHAVDEVIAIRHSPALLRAAVQHARAVARAGGEGGGGGGGGTAGASSSSAWTGAHGVPGGSLLSSPRRIAAAAVTATTTDSSAAASAAASATASAAASAAPSTPASSVSALSWKPPSWAASVTDVGSAVPSPHQSPMQYSPRAPLIPSTPPSTAAELAGRRSSTGSSPAPRSPAQRRDAQQSDFHSPISSPLWHPAMPPHLVHAGVRPDSPIHTQPATADDKLAMCSSHDGSSHERAAASDAEASSRALALLKAKHRPGSANLTSPGLMAARHATPPSPLPPPSQQQPGYGVQGTAHPLPHSWAESPSLSPPYGPTHDPRGPSSLPPSSLPPPHPTDGASRLGWIVAESLPRHPAVISAVSACATEDEDERVSTEVLAAVGSSPGGEAAGGLYPVPCTLPAQGGEAARGRFTGRFKARMMEEGQRMDAALLPVGQPPDPNSDPNPNPDAVLLPKAQPLPSSRLPRNQETKGPSSLLPRDQLGEWMALQSQGAVQAGVVEAGVMGGRAVAGEADKPVEKAVGMAGKATEKATEEKTAEQEAKADNEEEERLELIFELRRLRAEVKAREEASAVAAAHG